MLRLNNETAKPNIHEKLVVESMNEPSDNWYLKLFKKSVLKQTKLKEIVRMLGPIDGMTCLDMGADNGILSYYLRQLGGRWSSADIEDVAIDSIRSIVKTDVYKIDGKSTPFEESSFDAVVIIDFLEHIHTDEQFVEELNRIIKKGGTLIINVPHIKKIPLVHYIRHRLGMTDEQHGHVRPGYTLNQLTELIDRYFEIETYSTYSKFFSEIIDAAIAFAYRLKAKKNGKPGKKGVFVTGRDLNKNARIFNLYSYIYPLVWIISQFDHLLFFTKGYSLIIKARKRT